jgi:hypothetical protein
MLEASVRLSVGSVKGAVSTFLTLGPALKMSVSRRLTILGLRAKKMASGEALLRIICARIADGGGFLTGRWLSANAAFGALNRSLEVGR